MAGIGFELRKLYRQQGLIHNLKAYAYSTMTTVGPMILCLILVFVQQFLMNLHHSSYLENELFIATLAYCFVFSIIFTSGLSMIVTRFISDKIYEKKYDEVMNAYYGSLMLIVPIAALAAIIFLFFVEGSFLYKVVAYIYFVELIVIWMQNVFMSALKDYQRIFRGFVIAVLLSILTSYLLFTFTSLDAVTVALLGMNIGFAGIIILSSLHFEQVFTRSKNRDFFAFLSGFTKYPTIFFSGVFIYTGIYIHNIIYWIFSDKNILVADGFLLAPFYDVAVFYAYLSVVPSLIFFVVIIETDFYERFLNYYKNITDGGTYESLQAAKRKMQRVLINRLGFLAEVQLLFTTLSIALGLLLLPKIGFTIHQIDLFITLCFAYFFFLVMFVIFHLLMYFDDRKGVLVLSGAFILLCGLLSFITLKMGLDGVGMFAASFIMLCLALARLMYIISNIDYYTYCQQPMLPIGKKPSLKKSWRKKASPLAALFLAIFLAGCTEEQVVVEEDETVDPSLPSTDSSVLTIDDKRLYERDDDSSVTTLYATILPDGKKPNLDWYNLNQNVDRFNKDSLNMIIAEGKPGGAGPSSGMFGSTATTANAKVSLRGNTARNQPQKSYRIKLMDSAGTWHDQTTINLNKHILDGSRLRNKLSFDLMEQIPNLSSLRTQFVHLYVKDTTAGETAYKDYGLYTQIEQPNKTFLRNHLFDPNGYLYKVTFFEFGLYPDQVKLHTDPTYDKNQFESILEIKGREEHDKLLAMLEDVNNFEVPIDEVMERHFVEDNVLTWVATNILMDNMDTDANNFYIYSPLNNDKWLILPWDYDGGWQLHRIKQNQGLHQAGISNYWGNYLLNRYFKEPENVEKLTQKIEELHAEYINKETITAQLGKYKDTVAQYATRLPDIQYLPVKVEEYDQQLDLLTSTPETALKLYYEDLEKPKPFYQWETAELDGDHHVFGWGASYDFQGGALLYSATVARDPAMQDVVADAKDVRETEMRVPKLTPGIYYLKVTVADAQNNSQTSFDRFLDEETGETYFGVKQIEVY